MRQITEFTRIGTLAGAIAGVAGLITVGCGGQPVGGKLPRPDPSAVALGAAAAATALTLADPNSGKQKPEQTEGRPERRFNTKNREMVPASVLDRSEDSDLAPCPVAHSPGGSADADNSTKENNKPAPELAETKPGSSTAALDLLPKVINENRESGAANRPAAPEKCRPVAPPEVVEPPPGS